MTFLDRLASRVGIENEFRAASGEVRQTPVETKRTLLAAMQFDANSEAGAAASIAALDREEWLAALPAVRVAPSNQITVDVVTPATVREVRWAVSLECEGVLSGLARLDHTTRRANGRLDGEPRQRHRLTLPADIPWGYHRLETDLDDSTCSLIVTPGRCWLPRAAEEKRRLWGLSAQLYSLRSARNWGIGDFTDLRKLSRLVGNLGGDIVGLNPLHAMFQDRPESASPYSPQDRLLLNVWNIDVEALPELRASLEAQRLIASREFQDKLQECRSAALVDYSGVARLKLRVLKLLFDCCGASANSGRWTEFELFRRQAGAAFEQSCLFEALREHFAGLPAGADWRRWPAEYRCPASSAVARFAEDRRELVTWHAWVQWVADQQLQCAAATCRDMEIGLYRDLAVGADVTGAATWSNPEVVVSQAHIGAPPDIFNPAGQDWGLPPLNPRVLFRTAYRNFIDVVRANMRHAGGLRIDHIMALERLYWVPAGKPPQEGAYVRQPFDDLAGILALESQRNRCLIVGEDLGTVPVGFPERLQSANILSYRVLFFEQDLDTGAFVSPDQYQRLSVAVATNHDLPTIRGWWKGTDIELKRQLHLFPSEEAVSDGRRRRARDCKQLVDALEKERLLPQGGSFLLEELLDAVHAYLARTRSMLAIAQLDDITAEIDPVNVPGTSDAHPNWRRRLRFTIEQLPVLPRLNRLAAILREERP